MRSTSLDRTVKEKIAAAVMLTTPASPVASRIEMRIGSMVWPYFLILISCSIVRKPGIVP
jgi:hypothetical protein